MGRKHGKPFEAMIGKGNIRREKHRGHREHRGPQSG
jgi:hypothetical protein